MDIVVLGVFVAAVVGVVALFVFRGRHRGVATRIGDDGFFVFGDITPGTDVAYEALVAGALKRGTVTASGGETFVYTGTPPTEVRILGLLGGTSVISSPPPSSGPASSDAFTGFPSAY
jgi:hypothetical protein